MQTDNPHVREDYTCPVCLGPKNRGLLVCWPCHHDETHYNDGKYRPSIEEIISTREFHLTTLDDIGGQ